MQWEDRKWIFAIGALGYFMTIAIQMAATNLIDVTKIGNPVNTEKCITDPEQITKLDKSDVREKLLANDFVQCCLSVSVVINYGNHL